jgi:hypothetical protein
MVKRIRIKARRRFGSKSTRKRHFRDKRLPVLPLLGLASVLVGPAKLAIEGNYEGALGEAAAKLVGVNTQSGVVDIKYAAMNGWLPIGLGIVGSLIADKSGLNNKFRNVPFVGNKIKF